MHRDSIKVRVLDYGVSSDFELLVVKLTSLSPPIIVASIYRPPGAVTPAFRVSLANLFDQLQLSGMQFIVCGDVNCPGTSDVTLDASTLDLLHNYGLIQHVKEATHISGNLLDVIVTTDDDAQLVSHVFVEPAYFSDHHTG